MGSSQKPEYTGIDKYPGWIATAITFVIGGIFLGALSTNFHHDETHGESHGEDHNSEQASGDEQAD